MVTKTYDAGLELRRLSPRVTGSLLRAREATYTDGAITARIKALAALTISVGIRCEPCIRMYARKARELGATREELGEMLDVAMTMGGCPGEAWAQKALAAFDLAETEGEGNEGSPHCCSSDGGGSSG